MTPAELKNQVKQLKGDLKAWEHAFSNEHGRKPLKEDILQDKNIGISKLINHISHMQQKSTNSTAS